MSMKFDLKQFINPVFVETGTFHGGGVKAALNAGFEKILTLEVFAPLVEENSVRFQKEIEQEKVQIIHGDSGFVLQPAIQEISSNITFWLDAHIQSMNGGGEGSERCPIVAELEQILATRKEKKDIILIDDMRLIENRNVGWSVNLNEMYRLIWEINPSYVLKRIDGHIPYDVLCCIPGDYTL